MRQQGGSERFHAGIDLATRTGTPARTIAGGRVIRVGNTDPNGYGNIVAVETPTGLVEHFAHLNSINVTVGDIIQPGTSIGGVGSTGRSTGPHLDFSIWRSSDLLYQNPQENTLNPRDYMQSLRQATPTPRGTGPSPASATNTLGNTLPVAANFTDLYYEVFRFNGGRVNASQTTATSPASSINSSAPLTSPSMAYSRNAYPAGFRNNPEHNFGYEIIGNNREYRLALHRTAASLNIPTVWLADIIDFESRGTHSPRVTNDLGCVGLIQACPSGMLADLAQKWHTNVTNASRRLSSMTQTAYLRETQWWLAKYSDNGRLLNTIEDVYALINGGPNTLRMRDRSTVNDRNSVGGRIIGGNFLDHVAKLGSRAGRRYVSETSQRAAANRGQTHTTFTPGCSECARMQRQTGRITPHRGR